MRTKSLLIAGGLLAAGLLAIMHGCRTIPKGVEAVDNFDSKKYLGKWYEIARFDFRYEKNMSYVTAEYSMNDDGTIKVVNRGYDEKEQKWEESVGKARFVDSPDEGMLEVSFFGPFYAGYNVIEIDPNYKYALVAGKNRDYLWILSREKTIPSNVKQRYVNMASELGFDISELIWTKQI